MALVIPTSLRSQNAIYRGLKGLESLPKTTVTIDKDFKLIQIKHEQEFVPDFDLVWCSVKKHFRVYILIGSTTYNKQRAGYTICTVGTRYAAMGFGVLYGFLHKHRANCRDQNS